MVQRDDDDEFWWVLAACRFVLLQPTIPAYPDVQCGLTEKTVFRAGHRDVCVFVHVLCASTVG